MFAYSISSVISFITHSEDHMVGWNIRVTALDR